MAKVTKRSEEAPLVAEDRLRMARLSEEVIGRLEEMSLIIARTLGREPQLLKQVRLVLPAEGRGSDDRSSPGSGDRLTGSTSSQGRITAQMVWPAPGTSFGCYEDPPGICFVCSIEAD
jgi:hypothetical protein